MSRDAAPTGAFAPGRHLPALEGVRGLAVALVMLMHFAQPFDVPLGLSSAGSLLMREAAKAGWVGVDLFFVLSGFLITGILHDARGRPGYFRTFFTRRALRILPLYYGFLLVRLHVVPLAAPATAAATDAIAEPWLWLHLANVRIALERDWSANGAHLSHFWSLGVEEQFYLLWPVVVLLLSRRALMAACLGMVATAAAVRAWLVLGPGNVLAAYVLLPARMDTLAVGALIALGVRGGDGAAVRRLAWTVAPLALAALALAALPRRGLDLHHAHVALWGYPAVAALGGAVVALAATQPPGTRLDRALTHPALRFLGRYSYGLYVLHLPLVPVLVAALGVHDGVRHPVLAFAGFTVVATAASVALALLSWHLLEKHFLRLKDRLPQSRREGLGTLDPAGPARVEGSA